MSVQNKYSSFLFHAVVILLLCSSANGQIRSGAAFLSMVPGAKVQSMAVAQTGSLDEIHAIYVNPGAVGLMREWQWFATYSKWIADVYNASFVIGKRIRNPLSRHMRVAVGFLYQGMPEFDSSDHAVENVSANDFVFSLSLGQPVSALSRNISLGCNVKYFKSTLDTYSASSLIFDTGILARTPQISLGNSLFEYGIVSVGLSLTQLGADIKFDRVGTPLPQTVRAGFAIHAGTHNGIQLQVSGDFHNIKDEENTFCIGTELCWGNRFSVNSGYNFNSDLMSKVSFGGTIRLDDELTSNRTVLPGRNNAIKMEFATVDEGEFFARTYRGGMGHLPIGPEYFELISPTKNDKLIERDVVLKWEKSRDPDLYDQIVYTLLLDPDSTKLSQLISIYDNKADRFLSEVDNSKSSFLKTASLKVDTLLVSNLRSGHYYWAVFAQDLNGHIRFAESNNQRIAHFYIPPQDIEIKNITFQYSPWIMQDDYHGEIELTFANNGGLVARDFSIALCDSSIFPYRTFSDKKIEDEKKHKFVRTIEQLMPGEIQTLQIPWHSYNLGAHLFIAHADIEHKLEESNLKNNRQEKIFYTIPKGIFSTGDTATVSIKSLVTLDLPLITEICFDTNSTNVKREYLENLNVDPPVSTIAQRLIENPDRSISLKGFADPNSEKATVELANRRAGAIRDAMLRLGVNKNQIVISPGEVLPIQDVLEIIEDHEWIFEERRYVQITTAPEDQHILFELIRHEDHEQYNNPVLFNSDIVCAVLNSDVTIYCSHDNLQDSLSINGLEESFRIMGEYSWRAKIQDLDSWVNKDIAYYLSVTDRLERTFRTHDQFVHLTEERIYRQHRIVVPLKFVQTDPTHAFLFPRIFDEVNKQLSGPMNGLSFNGHSCKIGPDDVNLRLSKDRAERFKQEFKAYCESAHSGVLDEMFKQLGPAWGYGSSKPLAIDRLSGEHLFMGDNNTAMGRKLNRRIEVELFSIHHR